MVDVSELTWPTLGLLVEVEAEVDTAEVVVVDTVAVAVVDTEVGEAADTEVADTAEVVEEAGDRLA